MTTSKKITISLGMLLASVALCASSAYAGCIWVTFNGTPEAAHATVDLTSQDRIRNDNHHSFDLNAEGDASGKTVEWCRSDFSPNSKPTIVVAIPIQGTSFVTGPYPAYWPDADHGYITCTASVEEKGAVCASQ